MSLTATIRILALCSLAMAVACRSSERQLPLVGKAAPNIDAKMLDGSDFSLKAHASDVVVLDFWATWCPPCVMELPVVMKLADEYKDRGVLLYTVNAGEDPEEIKQFLKGHDWEFNVVLDPQGKAASAYDVSGIPQLVVIGRNGIVHAVHVGFSNHLEQDLRTQLNSLVAK